MTTVGDMPSRRLAAIMFTDLVGYSALAHDDEVLAIELLELHRTWVRELLPKHGGIEIETIGDAFLVEFTGALTAANCAAEIQQRFAEYNQSAPEGRRMQLRIGIHLGDVEHKDGKVMGDGVNIASRIHGMARPGGICVSEQVYYVVRNRRTFQFKSLGRPALKNIATVFELFELSPASGVPSPVASRPSATAMRWRKRLPTLAAGVTVLAILAGIFLWMRASPGDVSAMDKSVAVLPFQNLSRDEDNEYFADGLHDTVIGHLARIHDLKVISRTSVMRYRGQRGSLKEIARELGVAHILEGSVQRAGNKLRVVAQLIDAQTDTHVWSNEYDRELADVFAVQADIARQVAGAVRAKLSSRELESIAAVPTQNQDAYDLFLKAKAPRQAGPQDLESAQQAIKLLDEALELDPNFALAYADRSGWHDFMDWFGLDRSAARRAMSRRDAEKALALAPDLPDPHVAMAVQHYHGSLDYEAAIRELEIARDLSPGYTRPLYWMGVIYRRMDRWDDSLASFERLSVLDPRSLGSLREYAFTLQLMRRVAEAQKVYDQVAVIDSGVRSLIDQEYNRFLLGGDAEALARALDELPREGELGCNVTRLRAQALDALGHHDAAVEELERCTVPVFLVSTLNNRVPRAYFTALAKWYKNRNRTPAEAVQARAIIEKQVVESSDEGMLRMILAMALVMEGEQERALEEVERALKGMPRSRDAFTATILLNWAAEVHANTGKVDRAFAELEESLTRPGGIHLVEIRTNPSFAPLRSDPRYERLLAGKPL